MCDDHASNVIRKAASDEDFEDKLISAITTAVRKCLEEDPGLEEDPEFAITFSEYFSEVPGPTGYTSFRVTILRKDRKQLLKSLGSGNSSDWTERRQRYEARLSDGSLLYDVSADVSTNTVHVFFLVTKGRQRGLSALAVFGETVPSSRKSSAVTNGLQA